MMKVVVNSKEKKLAATELRIKELDRYRLILVSMEQIARAKWLFAARSNGTEKRTDSEEEISRERKEREEARKN